MYGECGLKNEVRDTSELQLKAKKISWITYNFRIRHLKHK